MTMSDAELAAARERFKQQRWRAGNRGIGWHFTFDEWLAFWLASGKWALRGIGAGKFVMARNGDVGPYSQENCSITPFEVNMEEGRARMEPPRGWTYISGRRRPFSVTFNKRYVGSFATEEEAVVAYRATVAASKAARDHSFLIQSASAGTVRPRLRVIPLSVRRMCAIQQ